MLLCQNRIRPHCFLLSLGLLGFSSVMSLAQDALSLRWQTLPMGENPPAALQPWQRYLTPDGHWRVLEIGTNQNDPAALRLPAGKLRWAGVFPEDMAKAAGGGVQIIGDLATATPAVEEVSLLKQPDTLLPVPVGMNLAGRMHWTPFGVEERVTPRDETSARQGWIMKPGKSPAGLYSAAAWRLPRWPRKVQWKLEVTLQGRGKIQVGVSGETAQGFKDPQTLKEVELGPEPQVLSWRMSEALAQANSLRLSLVSAPGIDTELQVDRVIWSLEGEATEPVALALPKDLGVWDWSTKPEQWRRLQPLWQKAGITVAQLALPRFADVTPPAFVQDLQFLRETGLRIVAVEGDPHMILPPERPAVLAQHQRLAALQGRYLDAIQYDVEPYLLPGFRLQAERWHQDWLELYQALARSSEAPVEAVVPFWLLGQKPGAELLQKLAGSTRRVVVMNYRSDPVEAAAWGTAWLEWSAQQRCPVALAIECGPIADVNVSTFRAAETGKLWVGSWPGRGTVVALFEDDVIATGEARTLALTREGVVAGSRTTLRGRDPQEVVALVQQLNTLATHLKLPEALQPRLLLHEPSEAVLQALAR